MRELRECMTAFSVSFQMSKKEREICEFEIDLIFYFFIVLIYVMIT